MTGTFIRFEWGSEDRIGPDLGPFPYAQLTYETINVGENGETILATYHDGMWQTEDGERWSDVVIWGSGPAEKSEDKAAQVYAAA